MLLEEAIKIHQNHKGKTDILELLWIEIEEDFSRETYYTNKLKLLKNKKIFISDLDWTFFRWTMTKEIFSIFFKFVKSKDITTLETSKVKEFLDDNLYFNNLEKKAYNKQIKYSEYINAWTFLLFKYRDLVNWQEFLIFLKNSFIKKQKVNPFRFSLAKMKEILKKWDDFVFVSWAPHFALEIYIDLLKIFIKDETWFDYSDNIEGFWTYFWLNNSHCIPLFSKIHKTNFVNYLKNTSEIKKIIWWMGDTIADYWISLNLDDDSIFYFVNPEISVVLDFNKHKKEWINYKFIIERKNLIFEMQTDNINILNIN